MDVFTLTYIRIDIAKKLPGFIKVLRASRRLPSKQSQQHYTFDFHRSLPLQSRSLRLRAWFVDVYDCLSCLVGVLGVRGDDCPNDESSGMTH